MSSSVSLKKIEYLLGTLLALIIVDGVITQFLIKEGVGTEGNPFLRTIVIGDNFLIIKMCAAILCVLILWNIAKRSPRLILIFSSCLVASYTGILFWNIGIFHNREPFRH